MKLISRQFGLMLGAGLCLGLGAIAAPAQAQFSSDLVIQVTGLRDQIGNVCIKLFASGQGFPNQDDQFMEGSCLPITTNPVELTLPDLAPGNYAIAVYHDRNGDGQLNRGTFGIPTEGYGFSNDPIIRTGPPNFQDAMFLLVGPEKTVVIQMQYSN